MRPFQGPAGLWLLSVPLIFPCTCPTDSSSPPSFPEIPSSSNLRRKPPPADSCSRNVLMRRTFRKGTVQMIQGGGEISARLCENPLVDGILFTGSFATGEKIRSALRHHHNKILALEMGGKNSALIWDCDNPARAVSETLKGCFWTTGQRCSSTSRIILNKSLSAEFKRRFVKEAEKLSVGHWKENPFMGPLIDEQSLQRFFHYQENIIKEGGKCLLEGRKLQHLHGHYVTPRDL